MNEVSKYHMPTFPQRITENSRKTILRPLALKDKFRKHFAGNWKSSSIKKNGIMNHSKILLSEGTHIWYIHIYLPNLSLKRSLKCADRQRQNPSQESVKFSWCMQLHVAYNFCVRVYDEQRVCLRMCAKTKTVVV